jgi:secreted Zn-dependent insulinase-like peptidase
VPELPKPIRDLPKQLNTDFMHANIPAGSSSMEAIYGQTPESISFSQGSNESFAPQAWYRRGWVTISPEAAISMSLQVPRRADSFEVPVQDLTRIGIYDQLLKEEMEPKLFDLKLTGVSYELSFSPHSISFRFVGYPPLLPRLMDQVLEAFDKGINVTSTTRYDRLLRDHKLRLQTFNDNPVSYAMQDRNILLSQSTFSAEEKLQALENISASSSASSIRQLLLPRRLVLQGLAMGNLDNTAAKLAFEKVLMRAQTWEGAKAVPGPDEKLRLRTPIVKPSAPLEIRRLNRRPGDTNDATIVSFLVGPRTVESRVLHGLLTGILHNQAYSYLRTNKPVGYIVAAGLNPIGNVDYVNVLVQGDSLRADKVEALIEYVLSVIMPRFLLNMTDDHFDSQKESFMQKLLRPPTKFSGEFGHFWEPLLESADCLNLQSEMLAYLTSAATSKNALVDEWNRIAYPSNLRTKIVVKHFAKAVPARATLNELQASWKAEGIPDDYVSRLTKEYTSTVVYDKVDSTTRADILKKGGTFFPDRSELPSAAAAAGQ